jgi:hypothetical protein
MAAAPRVVSRREWGAATTVPGGRFVSPQTRRFFVVHWPVMSARDERQWCRDIERMHRNQGWGAAPGYNYLVGQSGTVYEGCGRDVRGIHSPPRNTDGWGVCVLQPGTAQGRPTAPISDAARRSTVQLYDWLGSVAGRALNKWWHGRDFATACPGPDLTAWVRSGMAAPGGGAPAPPPQQPPQEDRMIASVVANGNLTVFMTGSARRTLWLCHQEGNNWSGGQAGQRVAGFRRWQDVPQGRTIRSMTAGLNANGVPHLFVNLDDASTRYTWFSNGRWQDLRAFAPAP